MAFGWLKRAVQSAGRATVAITHEVSHGISTASNLVAKVPIVGQPLHGVLTIAQAPFNTTEHILKGERIDHVALDNLKDVSSAYRDIAPVAQAVLAQLPVVGSGVAGAIAVSTALVNGVPLDKAAIQGFAAMVPGGPIGKAAFTALSAAVQGQNLVQAGLGSATDALNLPPEVKSAVNVVYRAAKGENISKAALEEGRRYMPPELHSAFDTAVAVGNGKRLQDAVVKGIQGMAQDQLQALATQGRTVMGKVPVFKAVHDTLDTERARGYRLAMGVMQRTGVNEKTLPEIRNKLTKLQRDGFDLGISSHVGGVMSKSPPKKMTNKQAAGYFATQGMQGAHHAQKKAMMKVVMKDPEMRIGVKFAIHQIKKEKSLWQQVKSWFTEPVLVGA